MFRPNKGTIDTRLLCRLLMTASCVGIYACKNKSINEPDGKKVIQTQSAAGLYVTDLKLSDPTDPNSLRIDRVTVEKVQKDGAIVGRLSFTGSRLADYVKAVVAPVGKDCQKDSGCISLESPLRQFMLPLLPGGEYDVSLYACVQSTRSKSGSECSSEPFTDRFSLPGNDHLKANEKSLIEERERYVNQLKGIAGDMEEALKAFEAESLQCTDRGRRGKAIEGMRILVQNFMQFGERLVGEALASGPSESETVEETVTLDEVSLTLTRPSSARLVRTFSPQTVESLKTNLTEAHKRLEEGRANLRLVDVFDGIQQVAGAVGLFEEQTPVNAVQMIGGAIFDIGTAKGQAEAAAPCLAEAQLERSLEVIEARIKHTQQRIADIDGQLAQGG